MNVADLIKNDLADFRMLGFPQPQPDIDDLVAFVTSLREPAIDHPPSGDADAGGGVSSATIKGIGGRRRNEGRDALEISTPRLAALRR